MTAEKARREKQKKESRDAKARREAKLKEDMKNPAVRFMNEKDVNGVLKYPVAKKIWDHILSNPDPSMNGMRLANSLLHELRWHQDQAKNYLQDYKSDKPVTMYDKHGKLLSKQECYTAYIQESQVQFIVLSKLRDHLTQGLLPTVDDVVFSSDQYNEFVMKVDKIVKSLGFELFPTRVEMIEPL